MKLLALAKWTLIRMGGPLMVLREPCILHSEGSDSCQIAMPTTA
ncbi:hypothetical protein Pint_34960 [Pistacia integerrima]|uniref:Uncharacterized protein n=1 Tax=Pistacia integerrima TaxID=434235 RepID=A0ACC0Y1I6_9ROSI|nr:hypothetical protein Pint_34960 [Pistacia integerrima]